jgi:hypothetical protein
MMIWNFGKYHKAAAFFRLGLAILITSSIVMGGMALNPRPAHAVVTFTVPPAIATYDCQPFTSQAPVVTGSNCMPPTKTPCVWMGLTWPPEHHTFGPVSPNWPGWLNLDPNTGVLSGCAPAGTAPFTYFAAIGCWSMLALGSPPPSPFCTPCFPPDFGTFTVPVNVQITNPAIICMSVDPVPIPLCWELAPFNMTCTVTGGVGPYTWTAAGLPNGLTMDAAGNITGNPALGTCNTFNNVTVTVTDTGYCIPTVGTCPCPTSVSRTFVLFVDCWANYIPIIFAVITTGCDQTVEIGPGLGQSQTNVLVDGSHVATLAGGQKYTITGGPCESHTVMVDQTVQPNSNTKFTVIGSNIKTFSENDNYAYFDYAPEVEIRTASDPPGATQPLGAGFYQVGGYFSSTVPGTIETDVQNGKKLVFSEWQLPDNTTRPNPNLGYTINQGGTVTAKYKTYYQMRLYSDYPAIDERSWELSGSTATWNLSLHAVPVESGFWSFLGVTQAPANSKGEQFMNGPANVEILWRPNYWPAIIAILVVLLVIAGIIFLVRWLRSRPAPQPETKTRVSKASTRVKKRTAKK